MAHRRSPTFSIALFCLASLAHGVTAQTARHSSLSQFGITWTFDKAYPAGQFANGDWWVVGSVKVVKIDPPSVSGSRVKNGSMINPSPRLGSKQGYDSAMKVSTYTPSLNVALDVSSRKPLKVPANSSLVSTISMDPAGNRPQLKGCSILTVLASPAKAGDFRPPYCGAVKTPRFNASQLNYALLRRLKRTSKTPSMKSVERMFERPWLDHAPGWGGREYHPKDNMRDYGRDLAAEMSVGALMLHLDFSNQQKAVLLKRFVQLGIDLQGIVDDGGDKNWVNNGGHASGRKWPILFAGLILNDTKMKGIGSTSVAFGEDQQTFIVKETKSGVFNNGYGGYTSKNKGMPEWGINHATRSSRDSVSWTAKYRQCCTANGWNGFVLCVYLMGVKQLWNHDALFAYVDRYVREARARKEPGWIVSWNGWTIEMWDAYRNHDSKLGLTFSNRESSTYKIPSGIHTRRPAPREIRLRWRAAPKAKSYRVYRGTSSTQLKLLSRNVSELFYTDPEVPAGKTFYYAVSARDARGVELIRSDIVRVGT